MNQLKFGKKILILSIMTLLTVFSWIGFEVYRTYTKPTIPKVIKELINPLSPTINQTVFEDIKSKYQPPAEELNLVAPSFPSPTPELVTEEEVPSSQTATEGGSLD